MKIAVLGTGMVGKTIASKLIRIGHEVKMHSTRDRNVTAGVAKIIWHFENLKF